MPTVDELIKQAESKPSASVDDLIAQAEGSSKNYANKPAPNSIIGKIRAGFHPAKTPEEQSALMSQSGEYPKMTINARTALEGIGTMAPGALSIPGYVVGKKLSNVAEAITGEKPTSIGEEISSLPQDISEGIKNFYLGKIVGKGIELGTKGLSKIAPHLYESAMKIPPSIPKDIRDKAIKTGLEGEYKVTGKGFERLKSDIGSINKNIQMAVDKATRSGNKIDMVDVVKRVDQLKDFYSSLPPDRAKPFIDELSEVQKQYLSGGKITASAAQKMKQAIYALNKKHYGEMKSLSIEADKAVARGLKEELVKVYPELSSLNAKDSSLINLSEFMERAVNRSRNYDIIKFGDTIAAAGGAAVGGPAGASMAGYAKHVFEAPGFKSALAIALKKSGVKKGFEKTGRAIAYSLPNINISDLVSQVEAGTLTDYSRGATSKRQQALEEAAGEDIPKARPASERTTQEQTPSRVPMSKTEQAAYAAETERLRQELERRKQAEKGGGKKMKAYIPVKMIRVPTPDGGEELKYVDSRGRQYDEDPND